MTTVLNQSQTSAIKETILQINDLFGKLYKMLDNDDESVTEAETKSSQKSYPNVYESIHDNDWNFATTQEVSVVRTEYYDWKPLRKFCVDNDLEIPKRHISGLYLNAYPAEAWFNVYGIVLGNFDV